jgi:hypothetical protein
LKTAVKFYEAVEMDIKNYKGYKMLAIAAPYLAVNKFRLVRGALKPLENTHPISLNPCGQPWTSASAPFRAYWF